MPTDLPPGFPPGPPRPHTGRIPRMAPARPPVGPFVAVGLVLVLTVGALVASRAQPRETQPSRSPVASPALRPFDPEAMGRLGRDLEALRPDELATRGVQLLAAAEAQTGCDFDVYRSLREEGDFEKAATRREAEQIADERAIQIEWLHLRHYGTVLLTQDCP